MTKQVNESTTTKHVNTYEEVLSLKTTADIIAQLELWIVKHSVLVKDYTNWFVGIADIETTTNGLKHLKSINAESMQVAMAVETYYHDKGMKTTFYKGGTSAKTKHVYIHKIN